MSSPSHVDPDRGFAIEHLDLLRSRLGTITDYKDYFVACCPVHDDRNPSLIVRAGRSRFWLECKAGCTPHSIYETVGLTSEHQRGKCERHPLSKKVETYEYRDAKNKTVYEKHRWEPGFDGKKKKDFMFSHTNAKGNWGPGRGRTPSVPYRLWHMLDGLKLHPNRPIFVVEGEKAVNFLRAHKLIATCFDSSADYRVSFDEYFRDQEVVIVADNDKAGAKHAEVVAALLYGVAKSVQIPVLAGAKHKDGLDDWIKANCKTWRTQLRETLKNTTVFAPTAKQADGATQTRKRQAHDAHRLKSAAVSSDRGMKSQSGDLKGESFDTSESDSPKVDRVVIKITTDELAVNDAVIDVLAQKDGLYDFNSQLSEVREVDDKEFGQRAVATPRLNATLRETISGNVSFYILVETKEGIEFKEQRTPVEGVIPARGSGSKSRST